MRKWIEKYHLGAKLITRFTTFQHRVVYQPIDHPQMYSSYRLQTRSRARKSQVGYIKQEKILMAWLCTGNTIEICGRNPDFCEMLDSAIQLQSDITSHY